MNVKSTECTTLNIVCFCKQFIDNEAIHNWEDDKPGPYIGLLILILLLLLLTKHDAENGTTSWQVQTSCSLISKTDHWNVDSPGITHICLHVENVIFK